MRKKRKDNNIDTNNAKKDGDNIENIEKTDKVDDIDVDKHKVEDVIKRNIKKEEAKINEFKEKLYQSTESKDPKSINEIIKKVLFEKSRIIPYSVFISRLDTLLNKHILKRIAVIKLLDEYSMDEIKIHPIEINRVEYTDDVYSKLLIIDIYIPKDKRIINIVSHEHLTAKRNDIVKMRKFAVQNNLIYEVWVYNVNIMKEKQLLKDDKNTNKKIHEVKRLREIIPSSALEDAIILCKKYNIDCYLYHHFTVILKKLFNYIYKESKQNNIVIDENDLKRVDKYKMLYEHLI